MLIEQIIQFESSPPGPLVEHIFPKLVIFMTQQNSQVNLGAKYLMLKMLQKKIYLASPDLGQITKFNPKMQDFKQVLNLTWSKGRDFSIGIQISKILMF